MPKRVNNIFDEKLTFSNMLDAYERSKEKKRNRKEVIVFDLNAASNIMEILRTLQNGTYRVGKYREFIIYEPKKRLIQSLPFRDRVVQQWYVEEFIKPIFVPKFIVDSYACINGRGVHSAVKKLNKYMYNFSQKNKDFYILKCDISKYFYSIRKDILYRIIERYIKDKKVLHLTKMLIYHNEEPVGIPIGNYTSQYFANVYLNQLDHFMKEKLRVKYYVRYMDDFVLLLENKAQCKEMLEKITEFLTKELGLSLNKKTNYFKAKQGVRFCGYKVYENHILLLKDNKQKIKRKIKIWNKLYHENKLDLKETALKLNSWIGHAKNADTYHLIKEMKRRCEWLYDEKEQGII
ncbi:MAG: RNA-dependent DNA polymerase [Clostridia bacterium]|jgi:RNA-directed DNA polymerase|nr:RNA-dependent DNA polymerase [Clostridia bacterium]MCI9413036.1 RNA-dependent DNA polymerase [Clostridia bacterium]